MSADERMKLADDAGLLAEIERDKKGMLADSLADCVSLHGTSMTINGREVGMHFTKGDILRLVAALRAPEAADAGAVAAWQWRCCVGGQWGAWLELDQPVERFRTGRWAFNLANGTAELRPLYTSPTAAGSAAPPAASADAVREQIARIIDPDLFEKYDFRVAEGNVAENGKPWAEVMFGDRLEAVYAKADAIAALSAPVAGADAGMRAEGEWTILDVDRALYVDRGRDVILCDRDIVGADGGTLLVKLRALPLSPDAGLEVSGKGYVSDRVFEGVRPVDSADVERLRKNYERSSLSQRPNTGGEVANG